ncbi:MAG TPA: curli-like amyloid fiber formation chaperone CsgH [Methylocystis sp.]|nr:curli-like amyloid fiber formation chaperone CsgH [Methylocystis sp.]
MQNCATASCVTAAMLALAATNGACAAEPPLACEIVVNDEGGGVVLRGVIRAREKITGSYRLRAVSKGQGSRAQISQGGDFAAAPEAPGETGVVQLGGGGAYLATLHVEGGGAKAECVAGDDRPER